ncbi:hypothetical protein POM88_003035 [Heracleum sosnowskyi]|uniref:Uncharacterized protein n=1 Tax=Heracleum sosnowskyi TaxID=360622 RepID=A0AAD8JF65_9APIA|nr:hypothetical protein POM88_003035 [Heracleum sosnowskyi]
MEDSDCFSLIDENDSLISSDADDDDASLTHLHSGDVGGDRVDGMDLTKKCGEQFPKLFETKEPEIPRKTGKLNLRKSLAWDKAFFESPGFLDAEEISTMIDGAEKGKKHLLPGIEEDISRSTESISTLASENLALESLENELFKDIRASIQKSSISTSNCKAAQKETDKLDKETDSCSLAFPQVRNYMHVSALLTAVKVDITSRNGSARTVTSKRQTGGMQGSGKISKKDSTSALATQPGLRNGNSSSSLPQPQKVITKSEAMPAVTTKRAFLGANRIKTETNNSKVGCKGVQVHVPMAAGLAVPRRSVPKPASLPKALGSASSGATIKEVGRSSCSSNGSKSTLTEKIQKSTSASARTKTISRPVILASSKIPLSKKLPGKPGLPSSLTPKISSSISPSSSISEWSSTSSSTSTVNQKLASRTIIDTNSSCISRDSETPSVLCADIRSNDGISDGILNQFKESPCQDMKKTNAQNNVLSRSVLMKASGLRMPSPKIGFFDGAKSVVHTPNACRLSQLRLPTGLPKIGASTRSPVGSPKKAGGKIQFGKKAMSSANTVLNTSKSAPPTRESSRASIKVEGDSKSVLSPSVSSEARSLNEGTGRIRPEMTLKSTQIELESQKSDSPKSIQQSASPGRSPEQSQSHLPTGLPKIRAAVRSPFGSSKKTEGNIPVGKKVTSDSNTVLDTSKSATPKSSPESSASMEGQSNYRSVISPDFSSEVRSSNEGSGKPWSKMTWTNTKTELEGQISDSVKPFEESVFVSASAEQSQSCLPTSSPEIEASIYPIGSSKKEGKIPTGEKATTVAITMLDPSKFASPTPSQESSSVLIKCQDDTESVLSPNLSSEMRSSYKGTGKPWPEMTLTSTDIELEGQKTDSPKPFQESACPGVSQSHSPTSLPNIGAAVHSPVGSSKKVEGNILSGKKSSGANTMLDTSESASPEPYQESSRDSMNGLGDHRSLLSPEISSEVTSSDEVTKKPCSELSLTSKNIELEGQKPDSPKPFQGGACPDVPQEQSQWQVPTCLPKIGTAIHSPVGSLKKAEGFILSGEKTSGANTVLYMSESASPEPYQESSRDSMNGLGDHRSLLSLEISSEATSSDEVTRKPCSELSLTSKNIELEGQKPDSPKPFQDGACPDVPQEQSQWQVPTCFPEIGTAIHSPVGSLKKAEGFILSGEKTSGANTVLYMSESASPEPYQESSRDSMNGLGDHRSLLSPEISSEVTSSDEVTKKPCSELSLTSKNIELEGQKPDSPKPFQGGACPDVPQEQSQWQVPTCLPKIGTAIHSPVGSLKKAEGFILSGEKTSGANTVLYMSESASPEPYQESSRDSMNGLGDHRSLLSLEISSEATSSDEVTRKPCSELSLTSKNIELEGQKPDSPKPFQDGACPDVPQEQSQWQVPTCLPEIGTAIHSPVGSLKKAEGFIPSGEKTSGANTMLYMSESASPEPYQESRRDSMNGLGDHRSLLSLEISSEATSSDEVTRKPCSELSLTSKSIELEGEKPDSPKPFQDIGCPDVPQEQSQCQVPTYLPEIETAIHSPVGSLKKAEGFIPSGERTSGANTVLYMSESASPEPYQESSRDLMKGLGDHRSLFSPEISSEVTSSDEVTRKPCSELSLTSKNIQLEGQKHDSPKPFQDSACPDVPQQQSQWQVLTCLPEIGTAIHSPVGSLKKAEGFISSGEKTSGANTVLYMSESASPEPSQESSRYLMKSNGDHRSLLSLHISSETRSSAVVNKKQCSELSLTSTNIELEGQKSDSAKPFQESASFGPAPEHQSCLPTGLPKIEAAICNPVESSKKEGKILAGEKATAGANTVLDTSKSASPEASQESIRASMEGHGGPWKLSPSMSSESRSSNMGSGMPRSEIAFTSRNIELGGQISDFPKLFQESNFPVVSPEILSEIDISNCVKAEDVKIGKRDSAERATANEPEAENDENLLLNI